MKQAYLQKDTKVIDQSVNTNIPILENQPRSNNIRESVNKNGQKDRYHL